MKKLDADICLKWLTHRLREAQKRTDQFELSLFDVDIIQRYIFHRKGKEIDHAIVRDSIINRPYMVHHAFDEIMTWMINVFDIKTKIEEVRANEIPVELLFHFGLSGTYRIVEYYIEKDTDGSGTSQKVHEGNKERKAQEKRERENKKAGTGEEASID